MASTSVASVATGRPNWRRAHRCKASTVRSAAVTEASRSDTSDTPKVENDAAISQALRGGFELK